jgi:hypothetical protein
MLAATLSPGRAIVNGVFPYFTNRTCGRWVHDFPIDALAPYGIEAQSPNTFLTQLAQNDRAAMIQILTEQAADLRNPPRSVQQELDQLALFAPTFAQDLRASFQQQESADT